jgi:hypothetical protein
MRAGLYRDEAFTSMYAFMVDGLGMSEGEAGLRLCAARTIRRYPRVLELFAAEQLHLSAIKLLSTVLNEDNHERLLAAARGRSKAEVEVLLAKHFPKPDVEDSIRKLPSPHAPALLPAQEPKPIRSPSPSNGAPQRPGTSLVEPRGLACAALELPIESIAAACPSASQRPIDNSPVLDSALGVSASSADASTDDREPRPSAAAKHGAHTRDAEHPKDELRVDSSRAAHDAHPSETLAVQLQPLSGAMSLHAAARMHPNTATRFAVSQRSDARDTLGGVGLAIQQRECAGEVAPAVTLELAGAQETRRLEATAARGRAKALSAMNRQGWSQPLSETRYKIQFTADAVLLEKLKQAQALSRHPVRKDDIATVVDEALTLLIAKRRAERFGFGSSKRTARPDAAASDPRESRSRRAARTRRLAPRARVVRSPVARPLGSMSHSMSGRDRRLPRVRRAGPSLCLVR